MLTLLYYRAAIGLAPLLPERFGYWLFARFGDLAFWFARGARRAYQQNLRHVLGASTPQTELDRITRRAFQNLLKNYFDLFREHNLTDAEVYAQLESVSGLEQLDKAMTLGRGIVGGSPHFGNFNMFVRLAALHFKREREIMVPVERIKPAAVFALLTRQRAAQGIELVPADQAARALVKALRAGGVLGLALDLDVTHTGPVVPFFGAPAQLPEGAAALAVKYNAPLILAFIRRLDNNKSVVVVEPPLALERTGNLAQDTLRGMSKIVERMEEWIRRYPEQWILFSPVWESDKEP